MNRATLTIFLISLFAALALLGYYLSSTGTIIPAQLPFFPKKESEFVGKDVASEENWREVLRQAGYSCKINPPVANEKEMDKYLSSIFNAIGVSLSSEPGFNSTRGDRLFIYPYKVTQSPKGTGVCWIVWAGNDEGRGRVGYEGKDGEIMKFQVKDVPL